MPSIAFGAGGERRGESTIRVAVPCYLIRHPKRRLPGFGGVVLAEPQDLEMIWGMSLTYAHLEGYLDA